ncbi:MAG: hypothetical protein KBA53_10435 [Thermoclostridium sp.]|nr:hypothetical protein [Thermoclostridium sp.]
MEKFKVKVQKRVMILALTAISIAAVYLLLVSGLVIATPSIPGFIKGFHMGSFLGVELILVFFTVKYLTAMKNEATLKKLNIEENDERTRMIMEKTGGVGMIVFVIASAIAAIVAGFFNETVFYTLLAATAAASLIRGACKLYFYRKL